MAPPFFWLILLYGIVHNMSSGLYNINNEFTIYSKMKTCKIYHKMDWNTARYVLHGLSLKWYNDIIKYVFRRETYK